MLNVCVCNFVCLSVLSCSHCIHQILESVNHIHQHDIVHRDLKVMFPLCCSLRRAARGSLEEARQEYCVASWQRFLCGLFLGLVLLFLLFFPLLELGSGVAEARICFLRGF